MEVVYQLILVQKYGRKVIEKEFKKYNDLKMYVANNKEKYVNKEIYIQQSNIIKRF